MIRRATADDARAIAQVWVASWLGAYRGLMPDETLQAVNVEARSDTTRAVLEEGSRRVFVVDDDGRIEGFASIGRARDPDAGDGVGELDALYLAPERWGCGLGAALHDAAIDELCFEGFNEATLWVLDSNARARAR